MSDNSIIENAQRALERLECEDWEVGPFDGHCLRLTCKRCSLDRVVAALAVMTHRADALEARVQALTAPLRTMSSREMRDMAECMCASIAPTYPVFRSEPHVAGCVFHRLDLLETAMREALDRMSRLLALTRTEQAVESILRRALEAPVPSTRPDAAWTAPTVSQCRCGRPLLSPGDADPWCQGCNMSASTCDCVTAEQPPAGQEGQG